MSRAQTGILAVFLVFFVCTSAFAANSPASPVPGQAVSPAAVFAAVLVRAEKGDLPAMLRLGALYENGFGVERNFGKALEWYRKAGDAGLPEAVYNVGICYEIGMGTAVNLDRAVAQYRLAAEKGLAQASYKLAGMYFTGLGLPKDEAKGLEALTKAADAGHAQALNDLALVDLKGLFGVPQDAGAAEVRFTAAAGAGSADAMRNLLFLYKEGLGGRPKDPIKALAWYLICKQAGFREDLLPPEAELTADLDEAGRNAARKEAESRVAAWTRQQAKAE